MLGSFNHIAIAQGSALVVAGGQDRPDDFSAFASVEVFWTAEKVWTRCLPMEESRSQHAAAAAMPFGVLITGGFDHDGFDGALTLASCEVLNLTT